MPIEGSKFDLLNLFADGPIFEPRRPILQEFCILCGQNQYDANNRLLVCFGCPAAYHEDCYPNTLRPVKEPPMWFCREKCQKLNLLIRKNRASPRNRLLSIIETHLRKSQCTSFTDQDTIEIDYLSDKSPAHASSRHPDLMPQCSEHHVIREKGKHDETRKANLTDKFTTESSETIDRRLHIPVPTWRLKNRMSMEIEKDLLIGDFDDISDLAFIIRHLNYENMEKEHRLEVLRRSSQHRRSVTNQLR